MKPLLIPEQQGGEFIQAAAPGQELVSRIRGDVKDTVDSGLFYRFSVCLWITAEAATTAAEFTAAVADEYQLDLLFETGSVVDIVHGDGTAAEEPDVGERIEILQSDCPGFHASHRQAGHGAMGLIGERTEIGIDVGD